MARCLAAAYMVYTKQPTAWGLLEGGGCVGSIGNTDEHGWACYSSSCGPGNYPKWSANVAQNTIANYYSGTVDERGAMFHIWAHELSHVWIAKACGGDPACGQVGQQECWADYYSHFFFDARPRFYSSADYRTFCTSLTNPYRDSWVSSYH